MGYITILSGGSGNDAIIKGLLYSGNYTSNDIRIITNAYDNGKSTGICRKYTNALGVSDIRKNHIKVYKYQYRDSVDDRIIKLYSSRLNLIGYKIDILSTIRSFLNNDCNLGEYASKFYYWCEKFFIESVTDSGNGIGYYEFKDFSIINIIYAQMYHDLGYETTNKYFCSFLGIDDCVILNSFDNVFIHGITEHNNLVNGEESIVEYCNYNDKISDIVYERENVLLDSLNKCAIDVINNSDIIIISTGTFWSSLYPTLFYNDFYKIINDSNANKIWIINTDEDKDSFGVTSNEFIHIMQNCGLCIRDFKIIENLDARESLRQPNYNLDIVYRHLGNNNGKNDYNKVFDAIKPFILR